MNKPKLSDLIGLNDLRRIPKWTGLPQDASRLIHRTNGSTLSDLFTIKRGLATGCNSFFVLAPDQAEQLNLPKKFLRPILPSPRDLVTDEILADEHGEPNIASRRYLLCCDLPETEVESDYPMLWRYLQRGIERKVNDGYICSHREPWYSQENRPPSPFLCTYMGRPTKRSESPFRFILNYSSATAANVYLMLYPKPVLAALLSDDSELYRAIWSALSAITAETLKGEGRVYGGGLHKLEPKELANVSADFILNALPRAREPQIYRQRELFAKR